MVHVLLQLVVPLVLYLTIFISGLIISIAMGLAKGAMDDSCPLYMTFEKESITQFRISSFGSDSTCDYVIYFPVIGLVVYPFLVFALYFYVFFRVFTGQEETMGLIKKAPIMMMNCVVFAMLFVTACVLSTGRSIMCNSYESASDATDCNQFEKTLWKHNAYNTSKLITHMVLAEVTAWICHIWLIILIVPTAIELWRDFRHPSRNQN